MGFQRQTKWREHTNHCVYGTRGSEPKTIQSRSTHERGGPALLANGPLPLSKISPYYGFGGGGQCGLLLPAAPRHCLSPGPGAAAHAVGTAAMIAMIAKTAINLLVLSKVSTPLSSLPPARTLNLRPGALERRFGSVESLNARQAKYRLVR
jgi:hypothetical protein